MPQSPHRMFPWALLTVALMLAAFFAQSHGPALGPFSVVAVTLYKAHLMALGGWGGYWLDRALFPYDRPHCYLDEPEPEEFGDQGLGDLDAQASTIVGTAFGHAMLRRAIVVAACLVCVGLGA